MVRVFLFSLSSIIITQTFLYVNPLSFCKLASQQALDSILNMCYTVDTMSQWPTHTSEYLGKQIIFWDEDGQPHTGVISLPKLNFSPNTPRPYCNIVIFAHWRRVFNYYEVAPAYKDESDKWHILNRWAFPGEVPDDEWIFRHYPEAKNHKDFNRAIVVSK